QTSVIAHYLMRILIQAGVPAGAINLMPADRSTSALLANHTDVDMVAFTGSKKVGLSLYDHAQTHPREGRPHQRVMAEMGGKNASNFAQALILANGVDYALTGGIYTQTPSHIERAKRDFTVGNLYINRGITGAMVNRQPFGGFKLSGIGFKAGGPDYLKQF